MEEVIPEAAGVRGPQSVSVLFPQDCKKLIQVCRGIQRIQQCDEQIKSFQMERLREEVINFMNEELFNTLIICVSDISQLHRLLQLKCVKDWVGWQEVKAILGKSYSNVFKAVIIEDVI